MRAFIALLLVAAATAKLAPLHKNSEPIPGKYIIKLKDGYQADVIASTVRVSGGRVGSIFRRVLNGFDAELSDKVLELVRSHPAVEYVEQNGVVRTNGATDLWNLDRIDQRLTTGNGQYSPSGTGSGKTVYVIDTGIRTTHDDFGSRASWGWTASGLGGGNTDCNGHGTHCAGTVAGTTYGVAKEANVKAVKVLGCLGSGSTSGVIGGMDWVADQSDADVASMSLGGSYSLSQNNAVASMVAAGVVVVVAAGNDNANACSYSPASASSAITVGATASNDYRSSFSNYGSCVDIFAPGSSITSAWKGSDSDTSTISGTSMACPHVAGAAAILLGQGTSAGSVASTLNSNASSNKVTNPGSGSPNKLLYVG